MKSSSINDRGTVLFAAFPQKMSRQQKDAAEWLDRSKPAGEGRPDAYMPKRQYLDELLRGELSEAGRERIEQYVDWVDMTPDALAFYQRLCELTVEELRDRKSKTLISVFKLKMKDFYASASAVSTAYWAAVQENEQDQLGLLGVDDTLTATFELAKRYREFTIYAENLLLEHWPNLSREVLFEPMEPKVAA